MTMSDSLRLPPTKDLAAAPSAAQTDAAALRRPLVLIGTAFVVAVWLAYFPLPILSFYKEWLLAMLLGLGALLLPKVSGPQWRSRRPSPEAGLVAFLSLVLAAQALLLDGVWPAAVLTAAYLFFFLFTQHLGQRLAALDVHATLLCLGATAIVANLGNALFTAAQLHGWDTGGWPLVAPRSGARLGGNFAQVNHAATLLWLGVLACLGAWQAGWLRRGVALALAALFGAFLIATGSRMPLLVAVCLFLASWLIRARTRVAPVRRAALALMGLAAGLPLLEVLWNLAGLPELLAVSSGGRRFANDGGAGEVRRWLLRAAWDAVTTHPLSGVGVGRFVHHTYALAIETGRIAAHSAELHAHNLVAHAAAELGVPAALAVAATLATVLCRCWRVAQTSVAGLLLACGVVIILIHAMLEYPLSYAYFLGSLGLMLGVLFQLDQPVVGGAAVSVDPSLIGPAAVPVGGASEGASSMRWPVLGLRLQAVGIVLLCLVAHRLQSPLERAMQEIVYQVSMGAVVSLQPDVKASLDEVAPWSPYRDYATAARIIATVPSKDNALELTKLCDRALLFGPTAFVLSRCAVSFQLVDQTARASALASTQCVMYPGTQYLTYQLFALVGPRHPEVLTLQAPCLIVTRSEAR